MFPHGVANGPSRAGEGPRKVRCRGDVSHNPRRIFNVRPKHGIHRFFATSSKWDLFQNMPVLPIVGATFLMALSEVGRSRPADCAGPTSAGGLYSWALAPNQQLSQRRPA